MRSITYHYYIGLALCAAVLPSCSSQPVHVPPQQPRPTYSHLPPRKISVQIAPMDPRDVAVTLRVNCSANPKPRNEQYRFSFGVYDLHRFIGRNPGYSVGDFARDVNSGVDFFVAWGRLMNGQEHPDNEHTTVVISQLPQRIAGKLVGCNQQDGTLHVVVE